MKQKSASTSLSRVLSGLVLSLALVLVACGGGESAEPTATAEATTTVAQPTQPPATLPSTPDISEDVIVVATPQEAATSTATTVVVVEATPEVFPTESAATPAPEASPVAVPTWVIANTPGDGTGGSGTPGERDTGEDAVATPEIGATPVAQLSIEGCELPHVPTFVGESDQVLLTGDVNFRSGPGVDCEPLLDEPLGEGQVVTVTGGPVTQTADDSEWVEVEVNGERGWITAEFIEFVP